MTVVPTLAELIEDAFREGYALGFEDAAACASGSPAGKSVDPVGPDRFWLTSDARRARPAEPSEPEPLDPITAITRDIARSA